MAATTTDRRAATFTLHGHPDHGDVDFLIWPADNTAMVSGDLGNQAMDIESARDLYRRLRAEIRAEARKWARAAPW